MAICRQVGDKTKHKFKVPKPCVTLHVIPVQRRGNLLFWVVEPYGSQMTICLPTADGVTKLEFKVPKPCGSQEAFCSRWLRQVSLCFKVR